MSLRSKFGRKNKKRNGSISVGFLTSDESYEALCGSGYTRLADNPEVQICVNKIANLISSMTIYLMENTDDGDVRVKDGLSRKIDIEPYSLMTRKSWMDLIVRNMLLEGDGNSIVYPHIKDNLIADLEPLPPPYSYTRTERGYKVFADGRVFDNEDVLHFVIKPDPYTPFWGTGYRASLRMIVENLTQAAKTRNEFMTSKWRPSVIISVDGLTDEFSNDDGRDGIIRRYISESGDGTKPWVIPADLIKVDQVRPLSLADLALNEAVELDKKTVARLLGVPPFFVGAGDFDKAEYNNFVNSDLLPLALGIQQELTKKLLFSPDRYFRFEPRSLYSYDIVELAAVGADLSARGLLTGNEARGAIGYSPMKGLDKLIILENFIPQDKIGDQKKLNGGVADADKDG